MRAHNANGIANAIALRANARLGRAHGARFVAQQANTRIASLAKARIPSGARIFRSKCMRASLAKARQPGECAHRWRMSAPAPRANAHDPDEFAPSSKQTSDVRAILGPTLPYSM